MLTSPTASSSGGTGVLLPAGHKWWRLMSRALPASVDDRIEAGPVVPTRRPAVPAAGGGRRKMKSFVWGQWESAAITFAGVAESDSSGEATATARRQPLSYDDCVALAEECKADHPGTKVVPIPLPHADRRACVVYIPGFFNMQDGLVAEMQRVKPAFIDRHSQNRGPTKTHHKNLRWNTNITDGTRERPADIYAACQRATGEARMKFAKTGNRRDLYIDKLVSSEIPFSQLPEFSKARAKISRLGEKVLGCGERKKFNLTDLCCELNFYFGSPCQPGGIGFHGDAERNLVFGGSIGSVDRMIEWCRFESS